MKTARHLPSSFRIVLGFAPWIAQGALAGPLGGAWATAIAFVLAMPPVAIDLPRRRVKLLEAAAALWFVCIWIAGALGHPPPPSLAAPIALSILALIAWGGLLLGRPFTEDYAREDWPEPYWTDEGFRAINRLITGIWGTIFTLDVLILLNLGGTVWVWWLLAGLKAFGIASSIALPPVLARRRVRRRLAEAEPEPWTLPDPSLPRPVGVAWDVTVIGAGVAGLAAAALLARAGRRVLVCEAHDRPGGYCSQWNRTLRRQAGPVPFVFDAGVHDISGLHERGAIRSLLRRLGVEDRIRWLPMTHDVITPAGRMTLGRGRDGLAAALSRQHPGAAGGIRAFLAEMEAVFQDMYGEVEHTNGIPRMPRDVEWLMAWPRRHPAAFRWMQVPFAEMLAHYVPDVAARQSLSFLTGYLTDRADSLSVGRMAPIFGMLFEGGHYPEGGSQTLPNLLVEVIRAHGGEVRLKTPVGRVLVEDGRAAGLVLADGAVERSAAVIAAGDVKRMLLDMVGAEHLPAALTGAMRAARPSCSAFMVTLAVDMVPDGAPLKSVRDARGGGLGIMVPSIADPGLCPPGHSVVTLLDLVPESEAGAWDRAAPDYRQRKQVRGDSMIARAEAAIPGLSQHILYRQDASPRTFERYARTSNGAIYGLELGGYTPHRRSPVPNLLLAGHGTALGAGVEAAAISGMLAAEDLGAFRAEQSKYFILETIPENGLCMKHSLADLRGNPK